jgi:peptide deformylase
MKVTAITTDPKLLCRKAKKISIPGGMRIAYAMRQYILENDIPCVGLAATQVLNGRDEQVLKRVFVMRDKEDNFAFFINPKIVESSTLEEEQEESCLSMPGRVFSVRRPIEITIKDALRKEDTPLVGMVARVFQHELDHLRGITIADNGKEISDPKHINLVF